MYAALQHCFQPVRRAIKLLETVRRCQMRWPLDVVTDVVPGRARGFAPPTLLDGDFRHGFTPPFNQIHNGSGCDLSHPHQWLSHRGRRRIGEGSSGNVVTSDDGNLFRDPWPCFMERPHRANFGNVIVGKKSGEQMLPRQELLRERMSNSGRRIRPLELGDEFRARGYSAPGLPIGGIRAQDLASNTGRAVKTWFSPRVAVDFAKSPGQFQSELNLARWRLR